MPNHVGSTTGVLQNWNVSARVEGAADLGDWAASRDPHSQASANAITPSDIERAIWLPHTILMAIATFGLAIAARAVELGHRAIR